MIENVVDADCLILERGRLRLPLHDVIGLLTRAHAQQHTAVRFGRRLTIRSTRARQASLLTLFQFCVPRRVNSAVRRPDVAAVPMEGRNELKSWAGGAMKTSLLMLITVAILASEGCKESMKTPQSKFLLKFQ